MEFYFSGIGIVFLNHIKNIDSNKKVSVDVTDKRKNMTTISINIFPAPDLKKLK